MLDDDDAIPIKFGNCRALFENNIKKEMQYGELAGVPETASEDKASSAHLHLAHISARARARARGRGGSRADVGVASRGQTARRDQQRECSQWRRQRQQSHSAAAPRKTAFQEEIQLIL